MKLLSAFATFIVLIGVVEVISCKKEYSCENCREANIAPVGRPWQASTAGVGKLP